MVERLNDRYELGEVLGAGGMGRVYRGRDLRLGREVAVKVLRGDRVGDEAARARFLAEARTAGVLNHPGIATVHDVGADAASADGDPFIVMQLVEGTPLSDVLRRHEVIGPDAVERLLGGVADALAVAHAAGVVHRDVKPANIVLSTDSRPVLVDFGIALGVSHEPLTETGAMLGTVEYIAPEQARGRTATGASDVYSLGLVAYQCLTGRSPFRRETSVAAALAQVSEDLPPLPDSVPPALAHLVSAMAAKDPDRRPTAAQVRDAVQPHTGGATSVLPALVDAATGELPLVAESSAATASTVAHGAVGGEDPGPRSVRRLGAALAATTARTRVFAGVTALAVVALLLGMGGGLFAGEPATVPDVVGQPVDRATEQVEAADAEVRTTSVDDASAKKGTVVAQDPEAGDRIADGDVVTLEVASGLMDVPADDLVGEPVEEVRAWLEKRGFVVTSATTPSSAKAGTVLSLDRSGRLPVGETVALSVATAVQPAPSTSTGQQGGSTSKKSSGSTSSSGGGADKSKPKPESKPKSKSKGKGKG